MCASRRRFYVAKSRALTMRSSDVLGHYRTSLQATAAAACAAKKDRQSKCHYGLFMTLHTSLKGLAISNRVRLCPIWRRQMVSWETRPWVCVDAEKIMIKFDKIVWYTRSYDARKNVINDCCRDEKEFWSVWWTTLIAPYYFLSLLTLSLFPSTTSPCSEMSFK